MHFITGRFCLSKNDVNCWVCAIPSVTYWVLLGANGNKFKNNSLTRRKTVEKLLGE